MISKKVLLVATYPIEEAMHGGQKRARAMFDYYQTIFNEVRFIAVYRPSQAVQGGSNDIPIEDKDTVKRMDKQPYLEDMIIGEAVWADESIRQRLTQAIEEFRPDVIQVEQPYPFIGLQKIIQNLQFSPKLVCSSHNVEHQMKRDIYRSLGVKGDQLKRYVSNVKALETDLAQQADLTIVVSPADARELSDMGARRVVVAPNGINRQTSTLAARQHWQKFKKSQGYKQLITFVGSAHPPNLIGFQTAVGTDLSFLPDAVRLMLAGGISQYMQTEFSQKSPTYRSFWSRAEPLGRLSDDNLAGLIDETDVILLPITSGGGSNLKTAEAILSGKKVVATQYAFRSYERYAELPNIYIVDDPKQFNHEVVRALAEPVHPRTPSQQKLAEQVEWRYCLQPVKSKIQRLSLSLPSYIFEVTKQFARRVARKIYHLLHR